MELNNLLAELYIPSPWELHQTAWSDKAEIELWIKRDDLIHPLISGNKWRKLSGVLRGDKHFNSVHTFGGPYSNHLVALGIAA